MRRVMDHRGAVAVTVAILMVAMVGFTAIAVDAGAIWMDRKELQNSADAAALALAQSCAQGACETDEVGMAQDYAEGNKRDENVTVVDVDTDLAAQTVTVVVSSTREHWFAPVIGHDSTDVVRSATAAWGGIKKATVLPLTVSDCVLEQSLIDSSESVTLYVLNDRDPSASPPKDPEPSDPPTCPTYTSGSHIIPGGFGWLDVEKAGECEVSTSLGLAPGDTGSSGPTSDRLYGCNDMLSNLVGQEVLLPLYEHADAQGASGVFTLVAYAHIRVESYCLWDSASRPWYGPAGATCQPNPPQNQPEKGAFITGEFLGKVELDATLGGPGGGSQTVKLIA